MTPAISGDVLHKYPCALSLLALWERPWSGRALRFAYHALRRAQVRGLNVLEVEPLMAVVEGRVQIRVR